MGQKYVFCVGQTALSQGVPRELAGCPFLVMPSGYPDRVNQYLRDLWTGNWHPPAVADLGPQRAVFTSSKRYRRAPSSIREAANRLVNFVHWCNEPKMHHGRGRLDPLGAVEKDIDRYGSQMEAGLWASDGKPLSASTIGPRQLEAIQFLRWAEQRGYASPDAFTIAASKRIAGVRSGGTRSTLRQRFLVVRRSHPSQIKFPTEAQVRSAIASVDDVALQLGFKLIFFCGLRASEVCELNVADVTDEKWAGEQRFIRTLGKGRKVRSVEIDDALLQELHEYVEYERPIRLRKTKRSTLLINENTGRGFHYRSLWAAFRKSGCAVSPHIGRHWYSIMYLLRGWRREQSKAEYRGMTVSTDLMHSLLSIDLIRLQQNLGHALLSTTQRYLVALSQFIEKADLTISFQEMIDGELENDQ